MAENPLNQRIENRLAQPGRVPPQVIAAYEAPFPEASYKSGAAVFPLLVPLRPEDPGAAEMKAARSGLAGGGEPALGVVSDSDPGTRGRRRSFPAGVPR